MPAKEIQPKAFVDAEVEIPGSKSYTNRALEIASLAVGSTELENALFSDDTIHMANALRDFGVGIEQCNNRLLVTPPKNLCYSGRGPIYVGDAGTAMRFLTGLCSLGFGDVLLTGDERMHQRPIDDLVDTLNKLVDGRIEAHSVNKNGRRCPPVSVRSKGFRGGNAALKGSTSSQFSSSVAMVSPYAKNDVTIKLIGGLVSKPYLDMTVDIMKQFGVGVEILGGYEGFFAESGQRYKGRNYIIECDASNGSYFLASAAMTGGRVRVKNVNPNSVQGDVHFADLLEKMGCRVEKGSNYIEVTGAEKLQPIEADMNSMPDTVQTLAVLAAVVPGVSRIYGIRHLKEKETDRISALERELARTGIRAEYDRATDSLTVYGGNPHGATIQTYGDHRMAMSFSVLGLKTPGIVIANPEDVSKSFPTFYKLFDSL